MTKIIHAILLIGAMLWLPTYSAMVSSAQVPKDINWIHDNLATDGTAILDAEMVFGIETSNDGTTWTVMALDLAGSLRTYTVPDGLDDTLPWYIRMQAKRISDGGLSAYSAIGTWNIADAPPSEPGAPTVTDPLPVAAAPAIRINPGGLSFTAADGSLWDADHSFVDGNTSSTTRITTGTAYPELFLTSRWNTGNLVYSIPVDNGIRTATLLFSETFPVAEDTRIFSIEIEGVVVESSFNIAAAAGGIDLAVEMPYTVDVTDGMLDITLLAESENPSINAIKVE